ncbi:hypothetical protein [Caulobacter sp.]|uniref:hypothetical protein n=1 Tax=Caulobacter sp. TaxID=78 RepID=UPI002B485F4E|nr:hypothetical protein [Caulobacter sp.]HJV43791.1 hypothetical protein [Caulobacter sp.]
MTRVFSRLLAHASVPLALLAGLTGASAAFAQATPTIALVPASKPPPVPNGMKVTCLTGPDSLQSSPTCPVIQYGGNTTWAFSFIDNRVSYGVVTYDAANNVVKNVTRDGARYVYKMTVDPNAKTVSIWGQGNAKVDVAWSDLPTAPPQVVQVPANAPPPVPSGLKVTCLKGPNTLEPSPTCPVVQYNGHTTWAFSFIDNRVSYGVVTYGPNNQVLANNTQDGARYVYKITVDSNAQTVSFWGQGDAKVTVPWSALP